MTPTVPVTVTLASQDGVPYAGVTVRARLDVNEVYQGFVISDVAEAVTDATGVAILNCFPNAPDPTGLGTQGSTYSFRAAIPGGRGLNVEARVPNAACRLENILVNDTAVSLDAAQLAVLQAQAAAAATGTDRTAVATDRAAIENHIYPGTYAVAPATRPNGAAIQGGDVYFDPAGNSYAYATATGTWVSINGAAGSFIQSGAGAVPRTYQDKLRESVSVEDFGSIGDGVADDFGAVQAALNAGAGKVVRFPAGTYRMAGGTPVVPSDTLVEFLPGAVLAQPNKGKFAGFAISPGSKNITIRGADIRGPWYGTGPGAWVGTGTAATVDGDTWAAHMAENIGIDVRGRWYQMKVLSYDAATMGALTDINSRIRIENCRIDGFGQSGILADQCTSLWVEDNAIYYCGRDGVRMYGAYRATVRGNTIGNLGPGFGGLYPNWNVYGVTATRVFGTSSVPDPTSSICRPSEDVLIEGNHVFNCHTWKSLDTHGGVNIRFIGNHVLNSHIGLGADQGGIDTTDGINPVRGLVVANNVFESSGARYMRAGMTLYGNNSTNQALVDLAVTGNVLKGYGGNDTDGGISLSNVRRGSVTGNTIKDATRSAINLAAVVEDVAIDANVINDPKMYVTVAASAVGSGYTSASCAVSGGGGSGLVVVPNIVGGQITSYSVVNPGTGYTSAPAITVTGDGVGATATATLNAAYGVLVQTTTASGSITGNQVRNETQATMRGVSLQAPAAGYGIKVGSDNQFQGTMTKVYPTLANEGGGTFARVPYAFARFDAAGTLFAGAGITANANKTSTGTYTVTFNKSASSINNCVPDVSVYNGTGAATAAMVSTTTLTVTTRDTAGAAADRSFTVVLWNVSP